MRRSEIFDSFVKIAQEKGLISDDKPTNERVEAEHTEKSFHETNPRHDSLSIEQISKLYNNKNQSPKEMEYKKNIMEIAHPDMVVLFPAHDKLNGLVENENEGQNIRIHISLKEPDGHLVQRKYAEKQLVMSLVRVANDLDNRNQEELCKLADVCLKQAAGFKKQAFWPLAIGVAAAIGALYAKQHLRFHSDGWEADYQKAVSEIDDLLNANSNFGVGYTYKPDFLQTVNELKTRLANLHTEYQKVLPILDKMELPHDGKELAQLSQTADYQDGVKALAEFRGEMQNELPFINKVITDFGNQGYKQRSIQQKGFLTSVVDSAEVLHGGSGLVADDFDDVAHALQTLKVDLKNVVNCLQGAETAKTQAATELEASKSETDSWFNAPPTPEAGAKPAGEGVENELSGIEEIGKGLLGGLGR